eukprot:3851772-Amphidinium_carterae.1
MHLAGCPLCGTSSWVWSPFSTATGDQVRALRFAAPSCRTKQVPPNVLFEALCAALVLRQVLRPPPRLGSAHSRPVPFLLVSNNDDDNNNKQQQQTTPNKIDTGGGVDTRQLGEPKRSGKGDRLASTA